jgi:hypothetical protein
MAPGAMVIMPAMVAQLKLINNNFLNLFYMFKYIYSTILFALVFSACTKKSDPLPISVVGMWKGKITIAGYSKQIDVVYRFDANSTMRFFYGPDTSLLLPYIGTYNVVGNQLNSTYKINNNSDFSESNILSADGKHFDGTYGSSINTVGGGLQSADKQ